MKLWTSLIITLLFFTAPYSADAKGHKPANPTKVTFNDELPNDRHLVLGVFMNGNIGVFGERIDNASNGALRYTIEASQFSAKKMETFLFTPPQNSGYQQILLVGMGNQDEQHSALTLQEIGGNAMQAAVKAFDKLPSMAFDVSSDEAAHIAYGAKLGGYYFDQYYSDNEHKKYQAALNIITPDATAAHSKYHSTLDSVANGIWHARNVANEPANVIYPQTFVEFWQRLFKKQKKVKVKVFDEKDMLEKGMGAIYGVGKGSVRPPRLMVVEYRGGQKGQAPVVIVGKGITFDTGGISIKGAKNMWNMKFDMSGAASTMGTLYALAGRQANVNVIGIAALAENMPSGNAQRPGDIVTSMSGKTIQIRSTDAEGRLVLADAVYYGDITYNPALLIDLATLTGSASRALGKDYAAFFSRHDELAPKFIAMGKQTGDQVWPLPLNDNHFKAIKNNVADLMNSGPKAPGASAGAAFVGAFVRESTPWVHLDIAGVAWNDEATPIKASPGSTSFGIRLLNGYIKTHFESD